MKRTTNFLWIFVLAFGLLATSTATSQSLLPQGSQQDTETDTIEAALQAIPLNEINSASTQAFALYSRAGNNRLDDEGRSAISTEVDSLVSQTSTFFADTVGVIFNDLNFRELELLNNTVFLLLNKLRDVQQDINRPLEDIQEDLNLLEQNKLQWVMTLEESDIEATPEAITKRISLVIRQSDSVSLLLQEDIDFLLTQSDKITSQQINLDQFNLDIEEFTKLSGERVLRRDMPALWNSFSGRDTTEKVSPWGVFSANLKDDSSMMATKYSGRLVLFGCLFLILVVLVFWIRATINVSEVRGKTVIMSLYLNEIFRKPVEVSLLLGLYLLRILLPEMPETYSSLVAVVAVYAILRVAFDILPSDYKMHLLEFAGAYILLKFYNLFYDQHFFSRLVLLLTQVVTLLFLFRFVIRRSLAKVKKGAFLVYMLFGIGSIYLILTLLALIGNLFGILSLSEFVTSGVIQSTFLVLSTYVGFHVSLAFLYLLMSSGIFKNSNIVKKQFDFIYGKLHKLLRFIFVLSWILISLSFFNFKQPFFEWGTNLLTREMHIGQATFSLINVILFFFVIWLSMFISRIVRTILQEEVFARVKVERGIPSTVNMLVRITLISIGFLLAAAAAGMKLSSLTIIIGAFSVGIGFGLQNIFNNLVSGLILAFERPIKQGDIVEVNSLLGHVKKIGIRSSIVRTFDGAEVIVPNGTLISNDLINWTLSDPHRRMDIRVGVAYGTDPEKVLKILDDVAMKNKDVLDYPKAMGYFIGFGDSSLDFRLLAWAEQEIRWEVESDLRLKINAEIKKAGIEIPFPQRDLHVRSVDGKVVKDVKK